MTGCWWDVAWRHGGETAAQQTGDKRRPRLGCDAALEDLPPPETHSPTPISPHYPPGLTLLFSHLGLAVLHQGVEQGGLQCQANTQRAESEWQWNQAPIKHRVEQGGLQANTKGIRIESSTNQASS